MSAADRIRQAIEALPEGERCQWERGDQYVVTVPALENVTDCHVTFDEPDPCEARADYIALLDPTVGAALADLLDVLGGIDSTRVPFHGLTIRIAAARDVLEQAIGGGQ